MAEQDLSAYELPSEVVDYITELEDALAEISTVTETEKSAPVEESDEDEEARITKALGTLPDDVAEILKRDREEALARKAEADEAIEKAAVGEYIAKAATYAGIVEDADKFGPQLRQVAAWNPDVAKALEEVLEGATAKLAKSKLFEELGTKAEQPGSDALAKATAIAKGFVEAGEEANLEAARGRVWQEHPDLYKEYKAETAEGR